VQYAMVYLLTDELGRLLAGQLVKVLPLQVPSCHCTCALVIEKLTTTMCLTTLNEKRGVRRRVVTNMRKRGLYRAEDCREAEGGKSNDSEHR
jgi:hypothetical protein